jgi:hypothetical protein
MAIDGAKTCGWSADTFDLIVYSTKLTPAEVRRNPHFQNVHGTMIGRRPVVMFLDDFSPPNTYSCNAAFATYEGEIIISVVTTPSTRAPKEDPCATLSRTATTIGPALPE